MRFFHNWKSIKQTKTGFTLNLEENWSFHAQVLEPWLIRVALEPPQGFEPQRSWMVNPGESFPWQGRKRQDLSVFSCPEFQRTRFVTKTEMLVPFLTVLKMVGCIFGVVKAPCPAASVTQDIDPWFISISQI